MKMIMSIFNWLHTFLISSGIAQGMDNFIREFFRTVGEMGEVIVLSSFFLIIFIKIFKFFLAMIFIVILIKLGIFIIN